MSEKYHIYFSKNKTINNPTFYPPQCKKSFKKLALYVKKGIIIIFKIVLYVKKMQNIYSMIIKYHLKNDFENSKIAIRIIVKLIFFYLLNNTELSKAIIRQYCSLYKKKTLLFYF